MVDERLDRPWVGLWIGGSGGLAHEHRNEYVYLRKTFELPAEAESAAVRVTADNRYRLYVNGEYVCRGPARCEPRHQAYDEINLAPRLRPGRNVIAVLAHHYGESTFQSLERGGWGFLLDGEVACGGGRSVPIHTNGSWKGVTAGAYSRRTTRYTVQLGFQQDFDAAKSPAGWRTARFDDGDWPAAHVIGRANTMPFENLEPRGIPFELEARATFAGVAGRFTGRCGNRYRAHDDVATLLAEERRVPAERQIVRKPGAALTRGGGHMTVLPTPAGELHAVVLDAGRETAGILHFDIEAAGGEIIDFFYTEHVHENGDAVVRARNGALARIADRYRCRAGRQRHTMFAWQGFRYVLAVFRDVRRPLKVHHLGYTFTSYPVERRGSFDCSDPLYNRIWETGAWTQQLCMHDVYMDCPWREQAQWWGDARVQWRVNMAAFGDDALFKRGLRQAAQSQAFHGLTYGLFPCEAHSCILPDYTLVWICSLWDYYFYTGDDGPVREHYDAVLKALSWFEANAGKDHILHHPGPGLWLFLDWAPLYKADCNATFTFQYLEALHAAAKMARLLDRRTEVRINTVLAKLVERAAVRAFWDPRGKQFFEGYDRAKGRPYRQVAQHGNAYAILTGVQPRWHGRIADRLVWIFRNHDRLYADNTGGNSHHPGAKYPIASTFFYAYVLQAMFQAGRGDDAMAAIRTLWGAMLDRGATTWYEHWNHGPETYGNTSACHAWSASPTYHLSEQIGGVTPAAPGFEQVRIAPRMFDLDHASVTTPTPKGPIDVHWRRVGADDMNLTVTLPKGITGVLDLPARRKQTLPAGTHELSTA